MLQLHLHQHGCDPRRGRVHRAKHAGRARRRNCLLPVQHGNAPALLGEFFRIEVDAGDQQIVIKGDCSRVKLVGTGMTSGSITIEGKRDAPRRGNARRLDRCEGELATGQARRCVTARSASAEMRGTLSVPGIAAAASACAVGSSSATYAPPGRRDRGRHRARLAQAIRSGVNLARGYPRHNAASLRQEMLGARRWTRLLLGSWGESLVFCTGGVAAWTNDRNDRAGLPHRRVASRHPQSASRPQFTDSPARHGLPHGRGTYPAATGLAAALPSDSDVLHDILRRLESR